MNDAVEIDNSKMYSKPDKNCPKCGDRLNLGLVLHNSPKNCEERKTYTYMEIGQKMHAECYIEHVIDTYLMNKMRKDL